MCRAQTWKRVTAAFTVLFFLCMFLPARRASAGWVPSRPAAEAPQQQLLALLDRADVIEEFERLGLDRAEAVRRVAGLTDAEAREADPIQSDMLDP